jgi:Transposase DDE domain group 1
VRLSHTPARTRPVFDDPNLVSHAGLVPVMALAARAGLHDLASHVRPAGDCGANADLKIGCLVAGMAAGADSIDDMGLLRHGAMGALFSGVRAPSTLGSFLRSFTWGNVRQAEKAGRELLARLARQSPLLPGADVLAFVDIDSTQKRVYGHKKQGAKFGHTKIQGKSLLVRGLNALAATVSTPLSAPVIAAARLRGGNAASARGAASLAAEAVGTARACGATGTVIVRMDSAYYGAATLAAIRRAGALFSVTVPVNASVRAAVAAIPEEAWKAIRYPRAVWDDQLRCWISDAEVAEATYTAFTSRRRTCRSPRGSSSAASATRTRPRPGRASCSPPGAATRSSPTPRSSSSRPRSSTAATRSSSRSSPTGTTAPSHISRPGISPRTPHGWSSRPWPSTSSAPPAPSPPFPWQEPAPPPSAPPSSVSPPAPPATAAATSPSTSRRTGTANANG